MAEPCSQDACWVCLGESTPDEPLTYPCHCPRPVHAPCLARWQLHSAGSREETRCRFCDGELPDWKPVLTPSGEEVAIASPTMSVTFNGNVHHVTVRGGPGGYEAFIGDIRRIFGITAEHDMQLAFDCADPVSGHLVKLNGAGAYQAAVHCATISAAKRLRGWSRRRIALSQAAAAAAAAAANDQHALSPVDSPSTPPRSMGGSLGGSDSGGGAAGGLTSVCSLSATEAAFAADLASRQC
ncbi:hypothetical protein WJX81_002044 [Elliptochloris bilobata]|uniref:RING-CH-type domain-containing protein n=1 Tax=Elliptochloris bilobata TaxID=381761 RepID=A0AAW1RD20_9CHLO